MGSTGLLSYPDFLIAEELNSVTAGLTRAVNETGDLNLLLLQDHVSVSTENGARCWQKYVLHLVAFISSPTKPSYREIFSDCLRASLTTFSSLSRSAYSRTNAVFNWLGHMYPYHTSCSHTEMSCPSQAVQNPVSLKEGSRGKQQLNW